MNLLAQLTAAAQLALRAAHRAGQRDLAAHEPKYDHATGEFDPDPYDYTAYDLQTGAVERVAAQAEHEQREQARVVVPELGRMLARVEGADAKRELRREARSWWQRWRPDREPKQPGTF